ncbi:hypothetical protein C8Q73DRAFT_97851 [Cubamyces lactineus]|nr:hypothetical protein C8Q73DRAFT_97851 [Cubamyces lactineus]
MSMSQSQSQTAAAWENSIDSHPFGSNCSIDQQHLPRGSPRSLSPKEMSSTRARHVRPPRAHRRGSDSNKSRIPSTLPSTHALLVRGKNGWDAGMERKRRRESIMAGRRARWDEVERVWRWEESWRLGQARCPRSVPTRGKRASGGEGWCDESSGGCPRSVDFHSSTALISHACASSPDEATVALFRSPNRYILHPSHLLPSSRAPLSGFFLSRCAHAPPPYSLHRLDFIFCLNRTGTEYVHLPRLPIPDASVQVYV